MTPRRSQVQYVVFFGLVALITGAAFVLGRPRPPELGSARRGAPGRVARGHARPGGPAGVPAVRERRRRRRGRARRRGRDPDPGAGSPGRDVRIRAPRPRSCRHGGAPGERGARRLRRGIRRRSDARAARGLRPEGAPPARRAAFDVGARGVHPRGEHGEPVPMRFAYRDGGPSLVGQGALGGRDDRRRERPGGPGHPGARRPESSALRAWQAKEAARPCSK